MGLYGLVSQYYIQAVFKKKLLKDENLYHVWGIASDEPLDAHWAHLVWATAWKNAEKLSQRDCCMIVPACVLSAGLKLRMGVLLDVATSWRETTLLSSSTIVILNFRDLHLVSRQSLVMMHANFCWINVSQLVGSVAPVIFGDNHLNPVIDGQNSPFWMSWEVV